MELEPPSNEPYLSTSLQDFWGRRWNLMVTNLLRHTVYKPVRSSLGSLLGQWAPLPAVAASFLVSGLMHELLFLPCHTREPFMGSHAVLRAARGVPGRGACREEMVWGWMAAALGDFRAVDGGVRSDDSHVVILSATN
ncbi:hypothetical protein OIU84_021400 [Salix udensis]|uniref:Wax synthase domain-containing protein n=1 Tax=Salix udensis TaxID=889485 RepID=A0AAD6KWM7_9ROSI|nr:hypothetical protein OIU84_021400 [Salix udensis]